MKIAFSFDDATIDDLRLCDLLVKYGFEDRTILYWPVMPRLANASKGRESLNEVQMQMLAKTFKVGSHTISHRLLTRIPLKDAEMEISQSREVLRHKFSQEVDSFSYPRGYANPDLQKLVQEAGYKTARSTIVGKIHSDENPYFQTTTVHVGCPRLEYGGKPWLEYAQYMLRLVKNTPNAQFTAFGHSWELTKFRAWSDFEVLLKALKEA